MLPKEGSLVFRRATLRSILHKYEVDHVIDVVPMSDSSAVRCGPSILAQSAHSSLCRVPSANSPAPRFRQELERIPMRAGCSVRNEQHVRACRHEFQFVAEVKRLLRHEFGEGTVGEREESVTVRRLDEVLEEISPGNDRQKIYLKLDTQGYDIEVSRVSETS